MGIMPFDCQPIEQVQKFIKKHYKGGTVLDFGCGAGRYANCFPKEMYLGVDGHPANISILTADGYAAEERDLREWKPKAKYDYLFSSVVFDQLDYVPKGWAEKYILVEPQRHLENFKVLIDEPLSTNSNIRLVVAEDL